MSLQRTLKPAGQPGANGADGAPGALIPIYDELLAGTSAMFDTLAIIPDDYAHLLLKLYLRGTKSAATTTAKLRFNNSSTGYGAQKTQSYGGNNVLGDGPMSSDEIDLLDASAATAPASHFSGITVDIFNYGETTGYKCVTSLGGYTFDANPSMSVWSVFGFWASTAAISRIQVFPDSDSWAAGSRFTLSALAV